MLNIPSVNAVIWNGSLLKDDVNWSSKKKKNIYIYIYIDIDIVQIKNQDERACQYYMVCKTGYLSCCMLHYLSQPSDQAPLEFIVTQMHYTSIDINMNRYQLNAL